MRSLEKSALFCSSDVASSVDIETSSTMPVSFPHAAAVHAASAPSTTVRIPMSSGYSVEQGAGESLDKGAGTSVRYAALAQGVPHTATEDQIEQLEELAI